MAQLYLPLSGGAADEVQADRHAALSGLVNVQAAGTANWDELGQIRVQKRHIHGQKARTGFHASLAGRPNCTWLHRDRTEWLVSV